VSRSVELVRRVVPWVGVVVLIVLAGAAAVGSAVTAPSHLTAAAATAGSSRVPRQSQSPSTSTTTTSIQVQAPTTTTALVPSTSITTPPSEVPQSTSTTTVQAQVQPCQASEFAVHLSTDKESYVTGETVNISLSITNSGPACSGIEGTGPCSDGATASNQVGAMVWISNPGPYGCPALLLRSIPSGWSASDELSWGQDECPAFGGECTHAQVAAGTYSIVGHWSVGPQTNIPSQTVKVTIVPA